MLVKKSAFDVLMNKKKTNNLLDKIKTESDSDSSIIIECVKKSSPKPKFIDKNKNEELHKSAINNTPTEVLSSFINVDTSFTLTSHTNQLTTEDTAFLKTIQANNIKQDLPLTFTIIDTIKLDKLFLNLNIEQHKPNIQETVVAHQDDDAEVLEQELEIKTRTRNKRFSFVDSKRKKNEKKKSSTALLSIIEQSTTNNIFSRNKQDNSELWTEKYMFKSEDEIVTNSSQFERLKEWLKSWKSIIKNEKKNNDKNAYESGSEYSYDSDGSNAESTTSYKRKFYKNAILLSGPLGCGKTSAVHIVAKQLGFKVFEVNSSSLRCKTQIIQELEGAMNSHHVSSSSAAATNIKPPANDITNMLNKKKRNSNEEANFKINKFFKSSASSFSINSETIIKMNSKKSSKDVIETKNRKKRKISLRKETVLSIHHNKNVNKKYKKDFDESENDCCSESEENSIDTTTINENESLVNYDENCVNIHKESLILFDEVDVVFREDVGFLAAINYFIKKSKKPIILTTNDYYLQEKINLNIEKISFNMPRVDAATKFLKKISKLENYDLATPSAYKILTDCKCDIRRALNQLQVIVSSTLLANTTDLAPKKSDDSSQLRDYLSNSLNNINKLNYFENFFFLDQLTKRILKKNHPYQTVMNDLSFKKYDQVLIKDGLSDNSSTSSNTSFNPFLPINIVTGNNSQVKTNDTCSFSDKHRLNEFYCEYMALFNNNLIDFKDWSKYGHVDQFNHSSNVSVNKFAYNSFKSTSSRSMSLDYRPFLQIICQLEEIKQTNNNKRRFLHYLPATSMGLSKEDFSLLAKSSLAPKEIIKKETNRNNDIFSDDILDPF